MRALFPVTVFLSLASAALAQPAGPFTPAQVDAGRQAYVQHCMMCHGAKLEGIGEAQKLVGKDFVDLWGHDTVKELFTSVKVEMPQNDPGSLSDEMYVNLVAFLLHANGAADGTTPLTADSTVKIGDIVTGTPSSDVAAGLKPAK
jgi:alcohol dehydrogenase (cytochrome c)